MIIMQVLCEGMDDAPAESHDTAVQDVYIHSGRCGGEDGIWLVSAGNHSVLRQSVGQ